MSQSHQLPTVTIEPKELPSKGLSYPKGVKFSYTAYTYGEVQSISASKKMTYQELLRRAFSGIRVSGTHMNPEEITLFDVLYLAIARKLSTLGGSEFEIQSICDAKKCSKEYKKVFNQKDVKFRDLEVKAFPLVVDLNTGETLKFSPITYGDFNGLCEGGMFYNAMKSSQPLYDDPIAMKAVQVRNMKFVEAYNLIKNITDQDDADLMDEIEGILIHNIMPLEHKCESCGRVNKLQLEGKESLIKPFRSGKTAPRNRIRYGEGDGAVTVAPKTDGVHGSDESQRASGGEA